jgi:hypothetical protein
VRDRTAEVEADKRHVERLLEEHEDREARLSDLDEAHKRTIALIRSGAWEQLGITRPEARRERYREIGLEARADRDGNISLTWGFGEGNAQTVSTGGRTTDTSSRLRAAAPSSARSSSGSSTPRPQGCGGGLRRVARPSGAC